MWQAGAPCWGSTSGSSLKKLESRAFLAVDILVADLIVPVVPVYHVIIATCWDTPTTLVMRRAIQLFTVPSLLFVAGFTAGFIVRVVYGKAKQGRA